MESLLHQSEILLKERINERIGRNGNHFEHCFLSHKLFLTFSLGLLGALQPNYMIMKNYHHYATFLSVWIQGFPGFIS